MKFIVQPWQLMLIFLAGFVNRKQQETIEYLRTENVVVKSPLKRKQSHA